MVEQDARFRMASKAGKEIMIDTITIPNSNATPTDEPTGEANARKLARKRIAFMERRLKFIDKRIVELFGDDDAKGSRDREEAATLRWAIAKLKRVEAFEPHVSKVLDLASSGSLNLEEIAGDDASGNRI